MTSHATASRHRPTRGSSTPGQPASLQRLFATRDRSELCPFGGEGEVCVWVPWALPVAFRMATDGLFDLTDQLGFMDMEIDMSGLPSVLPGALGAGRQGSGGEHPEAEGHAASISASDTLSESLGSPATQPMDPPTMLDKVRKKGRKEVGDDEIAEGG